MITNTITLIGAGNMGASLLAGLIKNHYPAEKLWITDPDREKLNILEKEFHIHTSTDNEKAIKQADVVILAVKPHIVLEVAKSLASLIQERKTFIISIAAGIREEALQKELGGKAAIVRCMPNTPALIGAGASALYANSFVDKKQHELAESILRAVGMVIWLENENDMDAVTALSGSGPAYFFLIMEALEAAGEKLGLSQETARLLTLQTALGAAKMALESKEPPETLRQRVTSPGGTTEAAIRIMEQENIQNILLKALTAAHARSKELSEKR